MRTYGWRATRHPGGVRTWAPSCNIDDCLLDTPDFIACQTREELVEILDERLATPDPRLTRVHEERFHINNDRYHLVTTDFYGLVESARPGRYHADLDALAAMIGQFGPLYYHGEPKACWDNPHYKRSSVVARPAAGRRGGWTELVINPHVAKARRAKSLRARLDAKARALKEAALVPLADARTRLSDALRAAEHTLQAAVSERLRTRSDYVNLQISSGIRHAVGVHELLFGPGEYRRDEAFQRALKRWAQTPPAAIAPRPGRGYDPLQDAVGFLKEEYLHFREHRRELARKPAPAGVQAAKEEAGE